MFWIRCTPGRTSTSKEIFYIKMCISTISSHIVNLFLSWYIKKITIYFVHSLNMLLIQVLHIGNLDKHQQGVLFNHVRFRVSSVVIRMCKSKWFFFFASISSTVFETFIFQSFPSHVSKHLVPYHNAAVYLYKDFTKTHLVLSSAYITLSSLSLRKVRFHRVTFIYLI